MLQFQPMPLLKRRGVRHSMTAERSALESWRDHHRHKAMALASVRIPLAYTVVWLVGNVEAFAR
jgi:hypothetical protein